MRDSMKLFCPPCVRKRSTLAFKISTFEISSVFGSEWGVKGSDSNGPFKSLQLIKHGSTPLLKSHLSAQKSIHTSIPTSLLRQEGVTFRILGHHHIIQGICLRSNRHHQQRSIFHITVHTKGIKGSIPGRLAELLAGQAFE